MCNKMYPVHTLIHTLTRTRTRAHALTNRERIHTSAYTCTFSSSSLADGCIHAQTDRGRESAGEGIAQKVKERRYIVECEDGRRLRVKDVNLG